MFGYCEKLEYLNIMNFNTRNVENMKYMFSDCYMLTSLNISHFDTTNVEIILGMFLRCYNLETIILPAFESSLTEIVASLFRDCKKLKNVNLTNFHTPNAVYMFYMFLGCESLEILDLSEFVTSNVEDMDSMFGNCISLTSLNLSNFDTSNTICMDSMFANCSNLQILDFRNIKINESCTFDNFLYNCSNLKYLNLFAINNEYEPFYEELNNYREGNRNITLCINDESKIPNSFNIFKNFVNSKRDCSNNCYAINKLYLPEQFLCVDDCKTYDLVEFNSECIDHCPEGMIISPENKCFILNCPNYYNYNKTKCLDNIPDGYFFFVTEGKTIDKCHSDCERCDKKGTSSNSNCISCKDPTILNEGNCVNSCDKGDFLDIDGIRKCKCENDKCLTCSEQSLSQGLCITCNEDESYYPKLIDIIENKTFID